MAPRGQVSKGQSEGKGIPQKKRPRSCDQGLSKFYVVELVDRHNRAAVERLTYAITC
jgi:hypothetical protein